jgi:hypothetical protein
MERRSSACATNVHDKCKIAWCCCTCHPRPSRPGMVNLQKAIRELIESGTLRRPR